MLAGMLSVLLVAGLIGLGVYLATDEPSAAPERDRDDRRGARRDAEAATPTPTSVDDPRR